MKDFIEGVGWVVCLAVVLGIFVWARAEVRPKPYVPPAVPKATIDPRPADYDPDWVRKVVEDRSPATDIGR